MRKNPQESARPGDARGESAGASTKESTREATEESREESIGRVHGVAGRTGADSTGSWRRLPHGHALNFFLQKFRESPGRARGSAPQAPVRERHKVFPCRPLHSFPSSGAGGTHEQIFKGYKDLLQGRHTDRQAGPARHGRQGRQAAPGARQEAGTAGPPSRERAPQAQRQGGRQTLLPACRTAHAVCRHGQPAGRRRCRHPSQQVSGRCGRRCVPCRSCDWFAPSGNACFNAADGFSGK